MAAPLRGERPLTSGQDYTPEMRQYIEEHRDRLFASEIAHNLSVIYGVRVSKNGVKEYFHRNRRVGKCSSSATT